MKKTTALLALSFACLGHETLHAQGALTPPGAPAPTQKSLQEIYDRTESRTAITSLPYEITQSGSYYLAQNPSYAGSGGITISVSGVTLDLNGFTLAGNYQAGPAISANGSVSQVVVKNGHILAWQSHGVDLSTALNSRVENISVREAGGSGIRTGFYSSVADCRVDEAGDRGVVIGGFSQIKNCIVGRSQSHGITLGEESTGDSLVVYQTLGASSIGIQMENGAMVSNSNVNSPAARGIVAGSRATVRDCTVSLSGGAGITLGEESRGQNLVVSNTSSESHGILLGNDASLTGARVHNASGIGIEGTLRVTVIDCVVESPGSAGVYLGAGAEVSGTRVSNAANYGFRLGNNGTIKNSTATGGSTTGFYLLDSCTVEKCAATSNTGDGFSLGTYCSMAQSSAVKNRRGTIPRASGVQCRGDGNNIVESNFVGNEFVYKMSSERHGDFTRCTATIESADGLNENAYAFTPWVESGRYDSAFTTARYNNLNSYHIVE